MIKSLPKDLDDIIINYIGYIVTYTDVTEERRIGRKLDYDKTKRSQLKSITGCFDYFIDEKELFKDCKNLIEVPKNVCVLVEDCSNMFYRTGTIGDISEWDVSRVVNMEWMFASSSFNDDISRWNVSSVINMRGMFIDSNFNSNISNWDVSNVKYMEGMFCDSDFNYDISGWNVRRVVGMLYVFDGCPCITPSWYD
jgi:surface protein